MKPAALPAAMPRAPRMAHLRVQLETLRPDRAKSVFRPNDFKGLQTTRCVGRPLVHGRRGGGMIAP